MPGPIGEALSPAGLIWRAYSQEAGALVSRFAAQPTQSGLGEHDSDETAFWKLEALSVIGPADTVRAITATVAAKGQLQLVSNPDPAAGGLRHKAMVLADTYSSLPPMSQIRWARPSPKRLTGHIHEGTIYSRLMETRYTPDNGQGEEFIITAESESDLPEAFWGWARLRLPAPMMKQWAQTIYQSGVSQGQIMPLLHLNLPSAYCRWTAQDLQTTIEILGQTGRLPVPQAPERQKEKTYGETQL